MAPADVSVIVAGKGFPAMPEYLARALPSAQITAVEPDVLLRDGVTATVLVPLMARVDGAMMDRVGGLRLVQQWGAGLEGVDIAAASSRNIAVCNVPTGETGNAASVAEWCVMAAIALGRQLPRLEQEVRQGHAWGFPIGRSLKGKTAGILGLGGIGKELAQRLRPFGMRLIGLKRSPDDRLSRELGLDWLGAERDLDEFLRRSEFLFLCLPASAATRGLIGPRELALLPRGAYLINAARGSLVQEESLVASLNAAHLGGAALDVYSAEPLPHDSALLKVPGLLATPHIAGVTDVSYSDIARLVAENIQRLVSGTSLLYRAC